MYAAVPVLAAELRGGGTVTVASGDVVNEDLYVAAATTVIDGTVNGDVFALGGTITVNGTINGGVSIAGQTLTVNGKITHGARVAATDININGTIDGDLIVAGTNITVAKTGKIGGDLICGADTARIDGPITGYIKGSSSEVTLTSEVGKDVELVVDHLTLTSTSSIQGNLTYTSKDEARIQSGARIGGTTTHKMPEAWEPSPFFGIVGKVISFVMIFVIGVVIIYVAPRRTVSIADSVVGKPGPSLGWGALILVATPIAFILVCITVIGIPLGLISMAVYGVAIYLAQIPVGLAVGSLIVRRAGRVESKALLIGALALGLVILSLLGLIPYFGFVVGLVTILFGLGALAVSERRLRAETR